MSNFFFFLALCFILVHEMDAIQRREWRIFPFMSRLNDRVGFMVFTGIHLPLYLLLFWKLFGDSMHTLPLGLVIGLDTFFVVHIFLHLLLYRHPKNEFTSVFSWILIIGAGGSGLIDLILKLT